MAGGAGNRVGKMVIMATVIAVLALVGTVNASGVTVNFWPQKDWEFGAEKAEGSILSAVPAMDADGDGLADMIVESVNYSSYLYHAIVVSGANGSVIKELSFSDVGSVEAGDGVAVEPALYGVTLLYSNGVPQKEHYFMTFSNHSAPRGVSVYSVDYPSLSVSAYAHVDVPTSITYPGVPVSVSVDYYREMLHIFSVDGEARLLYMGYYEGSLYGETVAEIQLIMMNDTLGVVWENKTYGAVVSGISSVGVGLTDFNGWGFVTRDHPDVVLVQVQDNTTFTALNLSNGQELWNLTVPGIYTITSPLQALHEMTDFFDYDRNGRVDMAIPTVYDKKVRLNFVNDSGALVGYYQGDAESMLMPAMRSDIRAGYSHLFFGTVDYNGDGYGDLLMVDNNTAVVAWDIKNNATIWNVSISNQSYRYSAYLSTNDVDGDGVYDAYLVGLSSAGSGGMNVSVSLVYSDGKLGNNVSFTYLSSGFMGTYILREISDLNGDGFQDAAMVHERYNDGASVAVNVSILSLKNMDMLWTSKVSAGLNNTDYTNWSVQVFFTGDVNGDGYGDVFVKLAYETSQESYYVHMEILSGKDGAAIWKGTVSGASSSGRFSDFAMLKTVSSWNQFDYNGDGVTNEIYYLLPTGLYMYSVSQQVPELNGALLLMAMPIALVLLRRRRH